MKRYRNLVLIIILGLVLALTTTGCWNRREFNTLAIVMGLGLDKAQEPDRIQVTAQIAKPNELKSSSSSGNSEGKQAFWNIQHSGNTLFSILRGLTHESNRKLYFPHIQALIIGRDLAEEGIQGELDFFARDHETRLNIWLVIAEDKASSVLKVEPELDKIPSINIAKLLDGQGATSQTDTNQLIDFISDRS